MMSNSSLAALRKAALESGLVVSVAGPAEP